MIQSIKNLIPKWLRFEQKTDLAPNDLVVHDSNIVFNGDQLDYIWFHLTEREAGKEFSGYRVVRLLHVKFIPVEVRSDAGLLQKMRSVLRGANGANVNLVYVAAGIFDEPAIGIVQCYGVASFAETLEAAARQSLRDLAVLEAGLKGAYRQMRLDHLGIRVAQWLYNALEQFPHAIVAVGHPDPRESMRENNRNQRNPLIEADSTALNMSLQQNEILYRGMSSLGEEFLLMVLAYSVPVRTITSMLAGFAEEVSIWASQQSGVRSASFGISLPAMLSGALAESASHSYGYGVGDAHTTGEAHTDGQAQSEGQAHTVGQAESRGWSHSVSKGTTITEGTAITDGTSVMDGTSHVESQSHTSGHSSGVSHTDSVGGAHTETDSKGWNAGVSSAGKDIPIVGGIVKALGFGDVKINAGYNQGEAVSDMSSWGASDTTSSMSMSSDTSGTADGVSHAEGKSHSESKSQSVSRSESESWGESGSVTNSVADTTSQSKTLSQADTKSTSDTKSTAESTGLGIGRSASSGLSVGIAPSFSIGESAQWQNDPAMLVTQILRTQEKLLNTASIEGAFHTDVYALARSERGVQALMGLIPESFQGTEDVVTGVQCRDLAGVEQAYIRKHAAVFTPSTRMERIPGVLSGYMDSTLLTMLQTAAYVAPGVFEQGAALTTQEETPAFAFYPDMPGDLILGKQYSVETGRVTDALLKLSPERHFHTAFIGDSGFGKSVAAERLAFEVMTKLHHRVIVLDFGQGWRRALRWPGSQGRVDIRQLHPGAERPLRWNFLQIPKRIEASRYRTMVCELFANAGRMGPRQLGFLRRALTEVYARQGVLFGNIEECFSRLIQEAMSEMKSKKTVNEIESESLKRAREKKFEALTLEKQERLLVSAAEAKALGLQAWKPVQALNAEERQALAVYRSSQVSIRDWIAVLRKYYESVSKKNDQASRTSLEGVLLRLEQFDEGQMSRQYGPGTDSLAIEDLGLLGPESDPWGVAVIEGGADMDEFSKAALFSLLANVLYADAIARRRESLAGKKFPIMDIFFEEANKVLSGVASGAASDDSHNAAAGSVAAIWESMWRDGRKYGVFLHLMAQTVSALPKGIFSSCANLFLFQTKDAADRDMVLPHLGKSEKGMVNTEYKRYLARIPKTYAITKLGYSTDVFDLEPVLIQPAYIQCAEPSDKEIVQALRDS
jgi:hypothetical protein